MMHTVLIIVNHNITIYKFRKELVEKLVRNGYRVVVLLPVNEETNLVKALGCEVIDVPVERRGTNPVHDIKLLKTYYTILKSVKPEVVLTYTIKPNVYGGLACRLLKIPYITTITGLGVAIEGGGILKTISLLLYRIGLRRANIIVFQNESNRVVFENAGIVRNNSVLVNGSGVNLEEYSGIEFPDDDSTVDFLFISRIMKSKGIDEFLEIAKTIKGKYPYTRFHVLGFCEDDYQHKLEEYSEKEIIQYHGMQEDITPFMRKAQCLIHPSYHEGMSNVCMEAAAAGRIVIASRIDGCRQIVEDGITGYLAESKNVDSFVEAVERMLSLSHDERKHMGLRAKEKMQKEFDRKVIVHRYTQLIENIIEENPRGEY